MDALLNPFAPGAGVPPPQLAGRSEIIKEIKFAYQRAILGKPSCFFLLLGQRGVGKTVLLGVLKLFHFVTVLLCDLVIKKEL